MNTSSLKVDIQIVAMTDSVVRLLLQRLPKPLFFSPRWKSQIFSPGSLHLRVDHWQRTHLNIIIAYPNNSRSFTPPSSYYIMGSSQNSDSRVKLYVEMAVPVIYAGQYLEGTTHLQVLEDTAYSDLLISLVGSEEVAWVERSEKLASTFRNQRKTYAEEFLLRRFEGGLKRGHYSFPFSVLLPSTLPATGQFSPRNSISFVLTLSLSNEKDKSQTQTYNVPISIRQPLRLCFSLSQYGTSTSECWKCLGSKTSGIFQLQVDKNEVKYGESFKIRGFIDNTNGQFSIDEFCVLLTRKVTKVSEEGKVKVKTKDLCELVKPKTGVKVGLQKKFQAEVTIPKEIKEHTAIGNIISRCYYLTLLGDVGCFYSDTRIEKQIHLNNDLPNTEVPPPTPPNDWNPKVYPQATFLALKPYLYQPCPELKIFNQRGSGGFPSIYNPTTSQNMIKMGQ